MATVKYVLQKCPNCGEQHRISVKRDDLPCINEEACDDELFVSVEAESIELSKSAFQRKDA